MSVYGRYLLIFNSTLHKKTHAYQCSSRAESSLRKGKCLPYTMSLAFRTSGQGSYVLTIIEQLYLNINEKKLLYFSFYFKLHGVLESSLWHYHFLLKHSSFLYHGVEALFYALWSGKAYSLSTRIFCPGYNSATKIDINMKLCR